MKIEFLEKKGFPIEEVKRRRKAQLPITEKKKRADLIMDLQAGISYDLNQQKLTSQMSENLGEYQQSRPESRHLHT